MASVSPLIIPELHLVDKQKEEKILALLSCLDLDERRQEVIRKIFLEEMEFGLSPSPPRAPSILMENTYIEELIEGTEEGEYLAIDLGGTNLRVLYLRLESGKITQDYMEYYEIPEHLKTGPGADLFDHLAICIKQFLQDKNLKGQSYELGFCFSFPMTQKAVNIGILNSWTKSYNCSGVVGEDAVRMLQTSLAKQGVTNVNINSILNDTTGTLVKGSYLEHRCAIGMILGTGSNACYLEKVQHIKKWTGEHTEKEVIIDIEWGSFGDNGVLDFLRTQWDDAVDDKSLLRKSFTFEKYFAGKYLGDLVREVLLTLAEKGLFCQGSSKNLETHHFLKTYTVAKIEEDTLTGRTVNVEKALQELQLEYNSDDIKILQYVCAVLSYRGCLLVSLLTAILINRMNRPHCTVAIDGSLFEGHPRFKPLMELLITRDANGKPFNLMLAKDGSGKGAGLVAAVEDRLSKKQK